MKKDICRETFKKISIYLIAIGILDIISLSFSIWNAKNGKMSIYGLPIYNIFSVLFGALLYFKGSMKVAQKIAFFAAFWWTGLIFSPIIILIFFPIDFLWMVFVRNLFCSLSVLFEYFFSLWFLIWIYRQLVRVNFKKKMRFVDFKRLFSDASGGFIISSLIFLFAISVLVVFKVNYSKIEKAAIDKAKNQLGIKYKYFLGSIENNVNNESLKVNLIAYNEKEIITIYIRLKNDN